MKKLLITIVAIIMLTSLFLSNTWANYYEDEIPEAPTIEWDDRYSTGYSSQRVTMTVRAPQNAEKIRFYLIVDDEVLTREKKVSGYDDLVSQTFSSLYEEQEVWGYVIAYDRRGIKTEKSEWTSEYIGKRSNRWSDVDIPDEPYMEWLDSDRNTGNSQRVKVMADRPRDVSYLKYYLICNGTIKESGRTQNESYTFTGVNYDQTVIAYVKSYDRYGDMSPQSPTNTLYIGDNSMNNLVPPLPQIQWLDQGSNNPYGQQVLMRTYIPYNNAKIKYFLISNGTVLSSPITTADNYTFYNIKDNQTVTGYIQILDRLDNPSGYSQQVSVYIPDKTGYAPGYTPGYPSVQPPINQPGEVENIVNRIVNQEKGISMKDFKLPSLWINTPFYFEDLPSDDWELQRALQYCYSTRLLENDYQNKFYPDAPMSRIEFLIAVLRATELYDKQSDLFSNFIDISKDYPYYNQVIFSGQNGIMRGYNDYSFNPNGSLTYGAATKALVNAFEIRKYNNYGESVVDDIDQHYIDLFIQAGIINNKPSSSEQELSKGNAVRILYRIIDIKMNK